MIRLLAWIGAATLGACAALGRVAIFAGNTLRHCITPPFYGRADDNVVTLAQKPAAE